MTQPYLPRKASLIATFLVVGALCAPASAATQMVTPTVPSAEPLLELIGLPVVPWRLDRPRVSRLLAERGIELPAEGPATVSRDVFGATADIRFVFNVGGQDLHGIEITWAPTSGSATQITLYNSIVQRFDRVLHHPVSRDTGLFRGLARELPTGPLRQVVLWSYARDARRALFLGIDGVVELLLEPTVRALARARAEDARRFWMLRPAKEVAQPLRESSFIYRATCEPASPNVSVGEVVVLIGVTGAIEEVQIPSTSLSERYPPEDLTVRQERETAEARTIRRFLDSCIFVPATDNGHRVRSEVTVKLGQKSPWG